MAPSSQRVLDAVAYSSHTLQRDQLLTNNHHSTFATQCFVSYDKSSCRWEHVFFYNIKRLLIGIFQINHICEIKSNTAYDFFCIVLKYTFVLDNTYCLQK